MSIILCAVLLSIENITEMLIHKYNTLPTTIQEVSVGGIALLCNALHRGAFCELCCTHVHYQ